MLNKIAKLTITSTIWNTLERTYVATSHSHVLELRTEIQSIKKDALIIDKYVFKLKSIADKLVSIGEPVLNRDQLISIFQGLGYDIIINGSTFSLVHSLITTLNTQFALKDLGPLFYFLSLKVQLTSSTMLDCKHCSTPMASGPTLSLYDGEPFSDLSLYQSIVGALQYHTLTSAQSEYKGLANVVAEVTWIEFLLRELHVCLSHPPLLLCDNISATYLAANPMLHARTKHVEIDYHFIRERVMCRTLRIQYTPSTDQLVDAMTKPLSSFRFCNLRCKLTILPSPLSLRGNEHGVMIVVQTNNRTKTPAKMTEISMMPAVTCKCKDKVGGNAKNCLCVAYENLRASQEEFFKIRDASEGRARVEGGGEESPVIQNYEIRDGLLSVPSTKDSDQKDENESKENKERIKWALPGLWQPKVSGTQVAHLVKAFERLLSALSTKDSDQKDENESKENKERIKWALPGLQQPKISETQASVSSFCPSELLLTAEELGSDSQVSSSRDISKGSIQVELLVEAKGAE
uniref:Retrovirus-related Pol polyprotein from transposon RE1 n=1 Tax=Vitis vinifera TaxID=29760 RepID=A5BIL9_VITVI|nr:hypothetical protein VITISV_010634 [Vitis vinifera]